MSRQSPKAISYLRQARKYRIFEPSFIINDSGKLEKNGESGTERFTLTWYILTFTKTINCLSCRAVVELHCHARNLASYELIVKFLLWLIKLGYCANQSMASFFAIYKTPFPQKRINPLVLEICSLVPNKFSSKFDGKIRRFF